MAKGSTKGGKRAASPKQKKATPKKTIDFNRVRSSISQVLAHLDDVLTSRTLATDDNTITVRFTSQTANYFYFWRPLSEDEPAPKGYPSRTSLRLGEIDGLENVFQGKAGVVKKVIGLSRVKAGGEHDPWSMTIRDNLYAGGITVSLQLDAKQMLTAKGMWELAAFFKAALMLQPEPGDPAAEYITLVNVFEAASVASL